MAESAVALSELPSDILQKILYKLASQDPLSLLRVTCTCVAFESAAAKDPGLWATAFFAPADGSMTSARGFAEKQMKTLEAEVESLGGNRRLLLTRWTKALAIEGASSANSFAKAQTSKGRTYYSVLGNLTRFSLESKVAGNVLILVRLTGKPAAYGVLNSHTRCRQEKNLVLRFDQIKLRLWDLIPLEEAGAVLAQQSEARNKEGFQKFTLNPGVLSLEFFALKLSEFRFFGEGRADQRSRAADEWLLYERFTGSEGWRSPDRPLHSINCVPAHHPNLNSCNALENQPLLRFELEKGQGWTIHWTTNCL